MRLPVCRAVCAAVFLSLLLCDSAPADSIFVGKLERKDVKVQGFRHGQVEFTIAGRSVDPVPADRISYMVLDDEPAFTKAEQAFAGGNFAAAAEGYQAVLKTASKPWLKDWILPRQLQAADRSGRFDLATAAYVQLATTDLNTALRYRPSIPDKAEASQLAAAASDLTRASSVAGASPGQQQATLSLLLDVRRAQGDMASAGKVAEQLLKVVPGDPSDPAVGRVLGDVRLSVAKLALAQKEYAKAATQIESNRKLFIKPAQQAEALYCLARARDGLAGATPAPEMLKDRAIDYMRVVAVARQTPNKKYAAEALMRVAELQEQLGDAKSAAALYAEVATEYKDNPLASDAAREQQRLKEKMGM